MSDARRSYAEVKVPHREVRGYGARGTAIGDIGISAAAPSRATANDTPSVALSHQTRSTATPSLAKEPADPNPIRAHVNPTHASSTEIVKLLTRPIRFGLPFFENVDKDYRDLICELVNYLANGHDPNQPDAAETALYCYGPIVLEKLLAYGYRPFRRELSPSGELVAVSPILDMGRAAHRRDESPYILANIHLIEGLVTRPTRDLPRPPRIEYASSAGELLTTFSFSPTHQVETHVREAGLLNEREMMDFEYLYHACFKSKNKDISVIEKEFLKDLRNTEHMKKYIEIIYFTGPDKKKTPIGFNIFGLISFPDEPNRRFVFCPGSFLLGDYRHLKVVSYLGFRLTFGMQQLSPNQLVGTFYDSISIFSYMQPLRNTVHAPKYITKDKIKLFKKLAKEVGLNVEVDEAGIVHILTADPIVVEGEQFGGKNPVLNLLAKLYKDVFRANDPHRTAFVYAEATDDHAAQITESVGFNFLSEIARLTPHLKVFLGPYLEATQVSTRQTPRMFGPSPAPGPAAAPAPVSAPPTHAVVASAPVAYWDDALRQVRVPTGAAPSIVAPPGPVQTVSQQRAAL